MDLQPISTKKKTAVISGITIVFLALFFLRLLIPTTYTPVKGYLLFALILWSVVVFIFAFSFL
jgi:hypothetical protein